MTVVIGGWGVGGAAITEELVPGYRFSRASYVCSLFRPQIMQELDLFRHGLKLLPRDPSSFTPLVRVGLCPERLACVLFMDFCLFGFCWEGKKASFSWLMVW